MSLYQGRGINCPCPRDLSSGWPGSKQRLGTNKGCSHPEPRALLRGVREETESGFCRGNGEDPGVFLLLFSRVGGISSALGSCKQRRILCCTNPGDAVLCSLQSCVKPTIKMEILPQKGVAHHQQHSQTSLSPPTWVRPWPWALDSHSSALRTLARRNATQASCEVSEGNQSPLSSSPHIPKHL